MPQNLKLFACWHDYHKRRIPHHQTVWNNEKKFPPDYVYSHGTEMNVLWHMKIHLYLNAIPKGQNQTDVLVWKSPNLEPFCYQVSQMRAIQPVDRLKGEETASADGSREKWGRALSWSQNASWQALHGIFHYTVLHPDRLRRPQVRN